MKKIFKLVLFLVAVLLVLFPFQRKLAYDVYPKLPINLCFLSFGGEVGIIESSVSYRRVCYEKRGRNLNDWRSCVKGYNPGACLYWASKNTNTYLCDKTREKEEHTRCYNFLLAQNIDRIHNLEGIEKYKVSEEIQLKNGEKFLNKPVEIREDGKVEFYRWGNIVCSEEESPPIPTDTLETVPGDLSPRYIFITGCEVDKDLITINYFRYEF